MTIANGFFRSVPNFRNAAPALMILQTLDELAVHAEDLEARWVAAPSEPVIQHDAASPDMGSTASLDMIYRENSYVTNTAALALGFRRIVLEHFELHAQM